MKFYTRSCKDSKYGYEMVASECNSYYIACLYIQRKLEYEITKCSKDVMRGLTEIKTTDDITFVYDEVRGYLMRKE